MTDKTVYGSTRLEDILEEIHKSTKKKRNKIEMVLDKMNNLISEPKDVIVMAPLMKDYFDLLIKNDDGLVKLATIVQRIYSAESYKKLAEGEDIGNLSDEERKELMALATEAKKEIVDLTTEMTREKTVNV